MARRILEKEPHVPKRNKLSPRKLKKLRSRANRKSKSLF